MWVRTSCVNLKWITLPEIWVSVMNDKSITPLLLWVLLEAWSSTETIFSSDHSFHLWKQGKSFCGWKTKKRMIYVWFFQYTIYKGRGGGGLGRCGCQICLEMQLQFSKLKYESSYLLDISKFINRIEWFVNLYHLKWGNIPTSTNLESAFANFFVTPCQDQNCKCNLNSSLTWKEE